jgi:hypothetical protein
MAFTDNSDPTAYLRALQDPEDRQRVDIIEKVKTTYFTSDRDRDILRLLRRLIENAQIRRDPSRPHSGANRVEGKGLCIIGPSGSGKSTLLEETFRSHAAFPNFRIPEKWSPLIGITAPGSGNLGAIGVRALHTLGFSIERDLKEHQAWSKLLPELMLNNVLFFWIDDLNNMLTLTSEEEFQKVRNVLKDLMNNPDWPLQLIVSGIPEMLPFFRQDRQFRRRFRYLYLPKLASADHAAFLQTSIEHLCEVSKIKLDIKPDEDLIGRLLHAGAYEMGICIEIVVEAVMEALDNSSRRLKRVDFANSFADRFTLSDDQNPFVATGWHAIDITRLYSEDADKIDDTVTPVGRKRSGRKS